MKLIEIAMVQVIGNIENKRCLNNLNQSSTMNFRPCGNPQFDMTKKFPYPWALATWKDIWVQYGFESY
jgi:hypothetical protein